MAEISKIEVNETEYDIKDATARQALDGALKLFIDNDGDIAIDYGGGDD